MSDDVASLLDRIGTDTAAGREALAIVAAFLRSQGHPLAVHMASAVREAEKAAGRDGGSAYGPMLLDRLGLTHGRRGRPTINPNDIGDLLYVVTHPHLSKRAKSASIAAAHGRSFSTGWNRRKKAEVTAATASAVISEIMDANGLASLACRRKTTADMPFHERGTSWKKTTDIRTA